MYEATFEITDDGGYTLATEETAASLELWCNDHCDLLHIRGPDTEAVVDRVEHLVGVRERLDRPEEVLLITDDCLRRHDTNAIEAYLVRNDCLLLPPLRYERGAKVCRVLALDSGSLTDLYRELVADGTFVDVLSKRHVNVVSEDAPLSPSSLLPDLSPRQYDVLQLAVEDGYYEIPRGTTTEAIADRLGVSRRTAEEHLRRAENKLIDTVFEHLRGRGRGQSQ
ncbi:transcriptional regulator [Halogeometricum borinquense]|uniref:Transcriptional regulator n=1 Tax=Halogeometricum borinquense TaxID=60847 RepID=A0A6C0UP39_9EURY|nr:helix-turn-helix domain-containing protein [Halogeometricum borinquense]QIB74708.1 transcriptional regulator [Halogeometricum borinquense]QIQ76337.1 transcriptional regulator [Halogeometricum borinquense]